MQEASPHTLAAQPVMRVAPRHTLGAETVMRTAPQGTWGRNRYEKAPATHTLGGKVCMRGPAEPADYSSEKSVSIATTGVYPGYSSQTLAHTSAITLRRSLASRLTTTSKRMVLATSST